MIKAILKTVLATVTIGLASCSPYTLVDSQTYNHANLANYSTFRIYYPSDAADLPPGMDMVTYYNIAAAVREQMSERGFTESPYSDMVINLGITVNKELATAPLSSVLPPPPPPAPVIIVPQARPTPPPPPAPGQSGPSASADQPQPQQSAPSTTSSRGPHLYKPTPPPNPAPPTARYFMYPRYNYWNNPAIYTTQVVTGVYREGVLTMDIFDVRTRRALFTASVATILDNGDSQFRDLDGINKAVRTLFSKFPVPIKDKQ